MKIPPKKLVDHIKRCFAVGLVPMVTGSPGTAKSDIIKQIADAHKLELIDIRLSTMDPVEMSGLPFIKDKKATWIPMDVFPLVNTPLPPGKLGWLVFFDELNSASLAMQAASYRTMLDKQVGQHRLHPQVYIACAGNLSTDGAIVNRMGTAMQSRLIHLELSVSTDDWLKWASISGIDHRIMAYVGHNPKNLHNFDPKHNDKTFSCPRTWFFASKLIKGIPVAGLQEITALLAGTVGEGVAREFIAHTEIYSRIPTYQQIIADPLNAKIGKDPSMLFGVAYMIGAFAQKKDSDNIMKYLTRLPTEYTTISVQDICQKDPSFRLETAVNRWATKMSASAFA